MEMTAHLQGQPGTEGQLGLCVCVCWGGVATLGFPTWALLTWVSPMWEMDQASLCCLPDGSICLWCWDCLDCQD